MSTIYRLIANDGVIRNAYQKLIANDKNYIVVNQKQETTIAGIYAAGDCTDGALKQIVSATADGAIAAMEAYKYIKRLK